MAAVEDPSFEHQVDHFLKFTGAQVPEQNAIFIMVMGMTGAGKSSFISHCTGQDAEIGHDLYSCTSSLSIFSFEHQGHVVYLIDTPGFDDTSRSDIQTLKTIAHYLGVSYANRVYIGGIIYLHRISDNRLSGTARRNIDMMKALCGESALSNVALATTMWTEDDRNRHLQNESELFLTQDWFGDMCGLDKARRFRHNEFGGGPAEARASALEMVSYIIQRAQAGPITFQIQSELVDDKRDLEATQAGKVLLGELAAMREHHMKQLEDFKQSIAPQLRSHSRDKDVLEAVAKLRREAEQQRQQAAREAQELKASLIRMHQDEEKRLLAQLERFEAIWKSQVMLKADEIKKMEQQVETQQAALALKEANMHKDDDGENKKEDKEERKLQQELAESQKQLRRLKAKLEHTKQRVAKKEHAGSKIREALTNGLASGSVSGLASGTLAVVLPAVITAGLMCSIM